jgi:hypothetical protein
MDRISKFFNTIETQWDNIRYREINADEIAQSCDMCDKQSKYVMWIEEHPKQKNTACPIFFCHKHHLLPAFFKQFPDMEFNHLLEIVNEVAPDDSDDTMVEKDKSGDTDDEK